MGQRIAKRVLLIGWDAADWKLIRPLLERERLPNLAKLIERGMMGNLATLRPMLSPMLWTSIATGKRPEKHGICGFIEPDASGQGVRPVRSTSRKCKALWNLLTQKGLKTHTIGYFASHPAEPISGICVSERFGKAAGKPDEPWPLPPGTVHPAKLEAVLADLRVHPGDIELSELLPFVPQAAAIDPQTDGRLGMLAGILAECASVHAAATWALETEPWDFAAVYYNAIDHFCHRFMYYHPPRMSHIPEADFALYSNVIWSAYCFHDLLLGRLLQLAGEDATVLLVSDHGYHSDHLRPMATPNEFSGPALWHRELGVCVLAGPGIRSDELLFGASILDVTPTILTLFGLPVGEDMDGRPWLQALEQPVTVERIASWDALPGACGMHEADQRVDPFQEQAAIAQLVDLGYIAAPSADARITAAGAVRDRDFNLAQALLDAGKPGDALPLLQRLHDAQPDRLAIALNLANAHLALNRLADCRRIVEHIAAGNCSQASIEDPSVRLVSQVDFLLGMLELAEGNAEKAVECLRRADEKSPSLRGFHTQLGQAYSQLQRWPEAEQSFHRALELDPDDPRAHQGMAWTLLAQDRNDTALDHALRSVGLLYHQPRGHYLLGVAFRRLGMNDRAIQALEVSLAMAPNQPEIHRQLADLHQSVTGDAARADAHLHRLEELTSQPGGPSAPPGD